MEIRKVAITHLAIGTGSQVTDHDKVAEQHI